MPEDVAERVERLNQQAIRLFQQQQFSEAIAVAEQARTLARQYFGENHPAYADLLMNLGAFYGWTGDIANAEPILRQGLEIYRATLEEDDPRLATGLENVGVFYESLGDYARAGPLYRQAADIYRTLAGPDDPSYIQTLSRLAAVYAATGNYAAALPLYREICDAYRRGRGEQDPDYIRCLNDLARAYYETGDHAAAEPLFRRAIESGRAVLGQNHPDVASSMNNLAVLYEESGNLAAAEPLYEQSLESLRRSLGDEDPLTVSGRINLAGLYRSMGKYTAAEPLLREVLEIRRATLDEMDPRVGNACTLLAGLYSAVGKYQQAIPLYREALEIARRVMGKQHPDVAQRLTNLAVAHQATGDFETAESMFREALDIRLRLFGEDDPKTGHSLNNLAELFRVRGDFRAAETLYRQAEAILTAALGEDDPGVAAVRSNLALLYESMGDYAAAESLARTAVESLDRSRGEASADFARSLNNLAELYRAMGRLAEAEPLHRRALQLRRRLLVPNHPDVAQSLNNLGLLRYAMGDYESARSFLEEAIDLRRVALGSDDLEIAGLLNNLAVVYRAMGNYAEVEPLYRRALEIRSRLLGDAHPDVAQSLNNLGAFLLAMGDDSKAESLFRGAVETARAAFGQDHPDVAQSLNNLAVLYQRTGKYAEAEPLYNRAIAIFRSTLGEAHPSTSNCLNNLAGLYAATGRPEKALDIARQTASADERVIDQVFSIGSESQRMGYLATLRANFDALLSLVLSYLADSPPAVTAAFDVVIRRKAIVAETLAAQREAVLAGRYPQLRPQLRELAALRGRIAQKALDGPGREGVEARRELLSQWNAEKDELEARLAGEIPEVSVAQRLRGADRPAVAGALPEGAALVEIVSIRPWEFEAIPADGRSRWKPARYLAFVLHARSPDEVVLVDLGKAEPVDRLIAAFRASTIGEAGSRHLRPARRRMDRMVELGTALRAAVFDPLVPVLAGATRLFLAPDGDLTTLPFEVLPHGDRGHLIDAYQISYLTVGRDLLRFAVAPAAAAGDPLVVADPDFDLAGDERARAETPAVLPGRRSRDLPGLDLRFERLAGTAVEGREIARMLGIQPLLGDGVLESRLKTSGRPRLLHIATHGFFLSNQERDLNEPDAGIIAAEAGRLSLLSRLENPLLRSGLALAGANRWLRGESLPAAAEDGLLTAEDVTGLDLLGTELVVLSACETGLGEVRLGEGVFGLRRAFVLAGAETLVMSLWKVPDEQSKTLMIDFYSRLLAGVPRAEALREAQLAMKAREPNPFFWGAFICQGDPGALSQGFPPAEG